MSDSTVVGVTGTIRESITLTRHMDLSRSHRLPTTGALEGRLLSMQHRGDSVPGDSEAILQGHRRRAHHHAIH